MPLIQLRREIKRHTNIPFCIIFLRFASSEVNKFLKIIGCSTIIIEMSDKRKIVMMILIKMRWMIIKRKKVSRNNFHFRT